MLLCKCKFLLLNKNKCHVKEYIVAIKMKSKTFHIKKRLLLVYSIILKYWLLLIFSMHEWKC